MTHPDFPFNVPFKPAPALKASLAINIGLIALLLLACAVLPIISSIDAGPNVLLFCGIIVVVIAAVALAWVHLYYNSMWYELRDDEMSWKRGVWFRTTGIIPYNRITNIDIRQGPVMRALGIHTIAIQTAGYSGEARAEIKIEGVIRAEELREIIRSMVRRTSVAGDGTGGEKQARGSMEDRMLEELTRIRVLLEEQRK